MPNKERVPSRFTVAERALFAGLVVFVVVTFALGAAHRAASRFCSLCAFILARALPTRHSPLMVASPISSTTSSGTPRKQRIPTSRLAGSLLAVAGLVLALAPTIQADIIPPIDYTGSYRLAFVTSTTTTPVSADIGTYNTFVTNAAAAITELDDLNTTWKVIGSTLAVSAKENTGTYITSDGSYNAATDVPIYTTTGKLIALNNDALWGGSGIANPINACTCHASTGRFLSGWLPHQRSMSTNNCATMLKPSVTVFA